MVSGTESTLRGGMPSLSTTQAHSIMVRKTLLAALLASAAAVGLRVSERQKKERLKLTFVGSSKNTTHYGDPADGCLKDETAVQVQGLGGDFCTPPCTGPLKSTCPTDVPKGVTAAPECALQDQGSGQGYCALVCIPGGHSGANQCGKATCKNVQLGIGICTYDD